MNFYIPKVAAVHDMSCFGRCSLTVIMATLSCMGIQVCPLPTAVLSTHLGGFTHVAFADFTGNMPEFFRHWKSEQVHFDCIYTGFLASEHQIDIVSQFIDEFSHNKPLVLIDPVMGDDGRLYSVYTAKMQERMRQFIEKAAVITPNYTEACFFLEKAYEPYIPEPATMKEWLVSLAELGPNKVVITGVPLADGHLLNSGFERDTGQFWEVISERIPARYPGTGDIFASVLAGLLLRQHRLPDAMLKAARFVERAIKVTFKAQTPIREGVLLERVLPELCRLQKKQE